MSVDLRTRVDGAGGSEEPAVLFGAALPAAFAAHAALLEPACRALVPAPLVVAVDDAAWTLVARDGRVAVCAGAEGACRLRLTRQQLAELVADQVTPVGWHASGTLDVTGGALDQVVDWWLLLRGALDGLAPHTAGAVALVDADGAPLDLARRFRWGDPPPAMRDFLERAGYLHVAGVFTEGEMAAVSADMDRAAPGYRAGDGRSWWARTADGAERLVRMQAFDEVSPVVARLVRDDRLRAIGDLTGDGHVWGAMPGNRIEALVKPVGVVSGISDVPWHKDCALGRHTFDCCSLTVGISVTGADASSGQLRVVAGSHRALTWPRGVRPGLDLPAVDLPTRTGDLTVHLSCTLHMAQPPVVRERRVLYTSFRLPPLDAGRGTAARQRLRAIREAAPVTVSQPAAARSS